MVGKEHNEKTCGEKVITKKVIMKERISRLRVCLAVFLKNIFNLKSVFEEKSGIWQNLGNTFKILKNHL